MNVNSAMAASTRSVEAQAVIDEFAAAGSVPPKNGSEKALHCDHVNVLRSTDLAQCQTAEAWREALPLLKEVVCVTAAENYRLQNLERDGADGWSKYDAAGITLNKIAALPHI